MHRYRLAQCIYRNEMYECFARSSDVYHGIRARSSVI
jgi:hypothetical protein